MSFQATKREIGEIYTFFRLLAEGRVASGTPDLSAATPAYKPIVLIEREEHDGPRRYYVEKDEVRVSGASGEVHFPRTDFAEAAELLLALLRQPGDEVEVPDVLENFLDAVRIYDLEAKTDDRTDLRIAFQGLTEHLSLVRAANTLARLHAEHEREPWHPELAQVDQCCFDSRMSAPTP